MKNKIRISKRLVDHSINAILIFASVFLAFWMTDIRTETKDAELTREARRAVIAEFKINLIILERWTSYHEEILEKGKDFMEENLDTISSFNLGFIPGLTNGIQRETLTNNGWGLVDDQQINFDLETRLNINQAYDQMTFVTRAARKISDDFLTQRELYDNSKTKENYIMFYSLLAELCGQENAMILRLKDILKYME